MDDVRIYNRALSADEIKRLYKMGATAKLGVVSNSTSLGKGLVGYWTFDGKDMAGNSTAGEYAFDVSGNGNRGTLTNGPKRVFGKIGQGILFNGGDDYVDAGTPSVLKITGNITISARVKFTSATQNMGVFAYFRINYAEGYMLATSNTAGILVFSRYGASANRHYQGLSCTISRR
jgi:hypothetical protein